MVTYMAYLCYPRLRFGDSTEDNEPQIKFEQPVRGEYEKSCADSIQCSSWLG